MFGEPDRLEAAFFARDGQIVWPDRVLRVETKNAQFHLYSS
jgi:hypothetical protein